MVNLKKKRVSSDVAFVCCNGKWIHSILELQTVLQTLNEQEYFHHVRDDANDFANWIEFVFNEKKLAQDIRRAKTQQATVTVLQSALKQSSKQKKIIKQNKPLKKTTKVVKSSKKVVPIKKSPVQKQTNIQKPLVTATQNHPVHTHITELEKQTNHLTKKKSHKHIPQPIHTRETELKDHLVDFALGFAIGIILGFILARGLGFL